MRSPSRRLRTAILACLIGLWTVVGNALAHVKYVTDGDGDPLDALVFVIDVVSRPLNALLIGATVLGLGVAVGLYLHIRPTVRDLTVLADQLDDYADLVPWMLRLSVGLPLVGAGFGGYLFANTIEFQPVADPLLRVALVGVGFFLLFGLATRIVAAIGLAMYLATLVWNPDAILAVEYAPGFLALIILGGGRPSADDILQEVASTTGTLYGRVDPVHHLKAWLDAKTAPYVRLVPLVLRVGLGIAFVYLGVTQKLANPGRALLVVEKYQLTQVVPVDPGLWVLGAGLVEMGVGIALILGFFTRASAATAFLMLTLTLFGLSDDPVLAHVTLFGMTSALFTLGSGPFAIDRWLARDRSDANVPRD